MKLINFKLFLKNKYDNMTENSKLSFLYTSIAMFLSHIVYFVDRWANEDDFHYILGETEMIRSGRWMPGTVFSSDFLMPMVLFIIALVSISIISIMINQMFNVKSKLYTLIISFLLATFPVLAFGFGYGFMVERYVIGMLFAVLAVFITNKYKYGFIIGGLALTITLGYYQSYIAIAIGLSILMIIFNGLENKNNKDYLINISKYLFMGIIGVVLYLILVKIICYVTGIALLDYKGINNIGSLPPISEIPNLLEKTYINFGNFYLGKKFINPFIYGKISQLILCAINVIILILLFLKNKIYKNKLVSLIIIIMILLLPLGLNIIDFMAYQSETSSLNIYQFIFLLIFPFILLNKIENKYENKSTIIIGWIASIAAFFMIWNNFVVTNLYYLKINNYYNSTVQLTNRIYDRIEQTTSVNGDTKIMIGNKDGIYMDRRVYNDFYKIFLSDQGIWDHFIGYAPRPIGTDFKFHYLVENIIGIHLPSATPDEFENIYNSKEYHDMESWPSKNSIKFINKILVVKIS